jgi:hypothetical protein
MNYGAMKSFSLSLNKFKPESFQIGNISGPFAARRHTKAFEELNREYSFSPKINRTVDHRHLDYVQKRQYEMIQEGNFEEVGKLLLKQIDKMGEYEVGEDGIQRVDEEKYSNQRDSREKYK